MSKPTKERVRELLNAGVKPKVIAQKLGIKPATVYTYRHIFKKEEEKKMTVHSSPEPNVVVKDKEKDWKELYEKLKKEHEVQLKIYENNSKEISRQVKEIDRLREENESLKKRNDELINEARHELEMVQKLYEAEKEKHQILLSYIFLEKKTSGVGE